MTRFRKFAMKKTTQKPSVQDMQAAIEHVNNYGEPWTVKDFTLRFVGDLAPLDLERYDDVKAWLELDPADFRGMPFRERLDTLREFRGAEWAARAAKWLSDGISPIIVITAPDPDATGMITTIGDGRGRVNLAVALGVTLPTWHMTYRYPTKTLGAFGAGPTAASEVSRQRAGFEARTRPRLKPQTTMKIR